MFLFSWQKVFYYAKGKPSEIMRIIRMLVNQEIPRNVRDPIYKYADINFYGDCFLLNADVLIFNAYKHTVKDLAIYIALASLRSPADYLAHNVLTLDLLHSPINPEEYMEDKTLLQVRDGKIYFLYEEADNQTKH